MRAVLALAVLSACGANAGLGAGPTLDGAIAMAREHHQALVIEVGAPWCVPCRSFAATVLRDPEVRAALAGVTFVQFDLETPEGEAAAKRLAIATLPGFVAFDGAGHARVKRDGGGAPTAAEFLALVHATAVR